MKIQSTVPSFTSQGSLREKWQYLVQNKPVTLSALILVTYLVVSSLLGLGAKAFFPQSQPEFIATIGLSVMVVLSLSLLGWWREAGFNSPAHWRKIGLVIIPFVVVVGLPFLKGFNSENLNSLDYLIIGYTLTGFMEEGLMRGIVLRVLKPTGITRSVVISSLLFGLLHIGNFLYRNPFIVLAQMVGAFVHGIGLSAIRLRTNTIWFVIILHGIHDLFLKFTNFPAIPLDVVQVTLLMIYGIYILRTWKQSDSIGE
jgi:uncharacterized protein